MVTRAKFQTSGFFLENCPNPGGIKTMPVAASISIAKGDALHDNGAGFATNAVTALAATFLGIAVYEVNNSAGSAGDLNVQYLPPQMNWRWIVPVAADALITATARGTMVDLEAAGTIDISDTTQVGESWGFFIDAIDASTEAVAATTFGYALGHFQHAAS